MAKINSFLASYSDAVSDLDISFENTGVNPPKAVIRRFVHIFKDISDKRIQGMIDYPLVDTEELQKATVEFLLQNMTAIKNVLPKQDDGYRHLCVDGKEQRGTGRNYGNDEKVRNLQTLHIYDSTNEICIYSEAISEKTNEIPVAQEALKTMNLKGCIVTFDALHMQKNTVEIIRMKKYDYSKTFTFEGKRYRVYGDSLEEVIEKKALKLRDLQENRVILNASTKVKGWVEIALPTYKPDISEGSMKRIRHRMDKHILSLIGQFPVSSVKPVQCQQILNNQVGKSQSYISKIHQDLCFIFRTALENQMIIKDPAASLHRPSGYTNHRRAITDYEREHLLKACSENKRLVPFLFMLYCGCRPAEALQIRANDLTTIDGIRALHIRGTKTDNADRYVPVHGMPDIPE